MNHAGTRRLSCILLCLITAVSWAVADEGPFLIAEDAVYAERPVHAITKDGYAVAWYDWMNEAYRFGRMDRQGRSIGEQLRFTLPDAFLGGAFYTTGHLIQVHDGFLFVAQMGAAEAWAVHIDKEGSFLDPPSLLIESDELYPVQLASGPSGPVLAYPEWRGFFHNWVQPLTSTGTPRTLRLPLAASTIPAVGPALYTKSMDLVRDGNRFLAVWNHYNIGVRLRELNSRGVPQGDVVLIQNNANHVQHVAAAAEDGVQLILYSEGLPESDILMKKRYRDGTVSDPVVLAGTGLNEAGRQSDWMIDRPLQALAHKDRLYVLYVIERPGTYYSWHLAEFDLDGNPTAPLRNLSDEYQINTFYDIDFTLDADHDRCVLTWSGLGPQSWGGYLLAVDCKGAGNS
ncbi:MAG: hypothetical protein IFK94_15985 [Acidobacteria bacterium]|uniref:Uncharacterized protein n=1 Tax=Candidatus Polarisedimenticola svalbardensis TaxID=2886004 RepID=A0A8J6XZ52_9BACT|nr:hypothetical protein [Candidatus Polarisedimenticola svalbardensis]